MSEQLKNDSGGFCMDNMEDYTRKEMGDRMLLQMSFIQRPLGET